VTSVLDSLRHPGAVKSRAFGHADEKPYRRLTGDWIRVGIAAVLLTASVAHHGDDTTAELTFKKFWASLPSGLHGFFEMLSRLGSLWAVALVAGAALIARRWRLALELAIAGGAAWFLGRFIAFVDAGDSVSSAVKHVFDTSMQPTYPTVPLAIMTAVILTASPFLTRPVRRIGPVVLFLVAIGTFYRASAGFNAVFAAFVLGWGLAAVLHLVFGSPAGRPTATQVAAALEELGVPASNVRLAPDQARGFTVMLADRADGPPLRVRVYGRDAADTQLVGKFWRFLVYKDSGATLTLTRLQQVEHEALCQIVAQNAGAHVPELVAAGVAGPSAALLVTSLPEGERFADVANQETTLRTLWRQVAALRAKRVAHGALDLDHVTVIAGVPTIVDFSLASVSAPQQRLDVDVANLLVSSALLIGADRAVAVALDGIGKDAVAAALPLLSKPALSQATRAALHHNKKLLDQLQQEVSTATDVAVLSQVELRRVKPLTVVMIFGLLFALWVILGEVGSIRDLIDTLASADWPWVVACAILTQLTQVSYAFTTIGSVDEKIPLGPAVLMQYAVAFTNLVLPTGAASTLMNIRFLQKQGSSIPVATSSGVLIGLSGTVTQFFLFIVTAFAVGQSGEISKIGGSGSGGDDAKLILLGVVAAAVLLGIVFVVPKLRRFTREKVWPQLMNGLRNVWSVLTTPRKLFLVMGGSIGAQLLNSLGLGAALLAYGSSLPVGELILVVTGAGFISSLVPVPGGIGVAEASLIAGLTAFGVPPEAASAAVVTYRLFTTYLPPIPGSYATKWLVANGDL
jgi:uncharacterized membrane protein YbhN (UPF0104 family)/tRNA A-37 threonylcarbamoyl transferase component Bud32